MTGSGLAVGLADGRRPECFLLGDGVGLADGFAELCLRVAEGDDSTREGCGAVAESLPSALGDDSGERVGEGEASTLGSSVSK
jgi:hypothetical protein